MPVWLVRILLVFAALASVLYFAVANVAHSTSITILARTYDNLAINIVLFCAALFGAVVAFLGMVWREFELRANLRKLRRENMRLDDELRALRNLPLAGLEQTKEPPGTAALER